MRGLRQTHGQKTLSKTGLEKDEIFAVPQPRVEDFNFGEKSREVFDDMLHRSVPFYAEIQRMIGENGAASTHSCW
jgi:hypothetical protein